jgi:hypothetical protein
MLEDGNSLRHDVEELTKEVLELSSSLGMVHSINWYHNGNPPQAVVADYRGMLDSVRNVIELADSLKTIHTRSRKIRGNIQLILHIVDGWGQTDVVDYILRWPYFGDNDDNDNDFVIPHEPIAPLARPDPVQSV